MMQTKKNTLNGHAGCRFPIPD